MIGSAEEDPAGLGNPAPGLGVAGSGKVCGEAAGPCDAPVAGLEHELLLRLGASLESRRLARRALANDGPGEGRQAVASHEGHRDGTRLLGQSGEGVVKRTGAAQRGMVGPNGPHPNRFQVAGS